MLRVPFSPQFWSRNAPAGVPAERHQEIYRALGGELPTPSVYQSLQQAYAAPNFGQCIADGTYAELMLETERLRTGAAAPYSPQQSFSGNITIGGAGGADMHSGPGFAGAVAAGDFFDSGSIFPQISVPYAASAPLDWSANSFSGDAPTPPTTMEGALDALAQRLRLAEQAAEEWRGRVQSLEADVSYLRHLLEELAARVA